jgi:hypothetical protein
MVMVAVMAMMILIVVRVYIIFTSLQGCIPQYRLASLRAVRCKGSIRFLANSQVNCFALITASITKENIVMVVMMANDSKW